ncbi:MAG: hypothetical protein K0V04_36275, partial [Deltaproteobacteria bacterium]|nr:hypothetical protein [Deltaproteobacteria bacterium]
MDTVIDRLELRHRLPPSESDAKARLDAIGRRVVEDGVPLALEHAGVLADEEVCIHHLTVSLRVDLSRGERAVARQWQSCLVTEILRIVQDDDPDEIVRYPNRVRALLDFAKSIVHGDLTRAWAWRQLGLVQARELDLGRARRELVTGLCAHPEAIGAVVGALAERVHDDALHIALSPDAWDSLARAVLRRFGHGPGVLQAARSTDARPSIEHRDRTEPVGTAVGTASDELVASAEREPTWLELPWRTTPALRRIAARLPGDRRHAVAVVALAAHEPAAIYGRPRSNLVQQLCAMTRRVGPRPVRVARPEFPAAEDTQERTYEDDERGAPGFRMDRDPSSNPITLEHPVDAMSPTTPTLRPEPSPSSTTPPSREFESTTPPNDL